MSKDVNIKFRIDNLKKSKWKMVCRERHISMTDLIIDSVENRIFDNERKDVLAFLEKQDNIFIKIQTNINQVARIANGQKSISDVELEKFTSMIIQLTILKKEQNRIFEKIYSVLAK
ncbi:MAG: hypothetical protein LC112_16065 [Flavobacteriales bacterium]|nr:hypothetical protein [Flavobacteriales bacterium]